MRRIRIIANVSLDGVVQAPGGPDEDRDGGFDHGGWTPPFFDPAVGEAIDAAQAGGFDLLLGRRTYDIFAGYWPEQDGPMAESLNAATKHVATHRPESLDWGPVESLDADLAEGVRRRKAEDGPDLIVWGSSTLTSTLIGQGLADEVLLLVYPVLLGKGKRLFSGDTDASELALAGTKTAPSGVLMNTYRYAGPLRTGSFAEPPDQAGS
jgi:dihydrofolate reductase